MFIQSPTRLYIVTHKFFFLALGALALHIADSVIVIPERHLTYIWNICDFRKRYGTSATHKESLFAAKMLAKRCYSFPASKDWQHTYTTVSFLIHTHTYILSRFLLRNRLTDVSNMSWAANGQRIHSQHQVLVSRLNNGVVQHTHSM